MWRLVGWVLKIQVLCLSCCQCVLQSPFFLCIVGIVGIVGIRIGNFKASIFGVYRNLVDLLIYSLENFLHFFSSMKMWFQPIERSFYDIETSAFARFWKFVKYKLPNFYNRVSIGSQQYIYTKMHKCFSLHIIVCIAKFG